MREAVLAVLLLVGIAPANSAETNPSAPTEAVARERRWQEDLDYLVRELPAKHKDFFKLIPKPKFKSEISGLKDELPQLSDAQVVLRLKRLLAGLGVAHTGVGWPSGALAFNQYPISLYWYSDGPAVLSAASEHREAVGARVVGIGSLTPEQAEAAVAPYISHENSGGLHAASPRYLETPEVLQCLGIAGPDGHMQLSLVARDGKPLTLQLSPLEPGRPVQWTTVWKELSLPTPLNHTRGTAYWYQYLPEARALYVHYRHCRNDPRYPFASFVRDVFACADANSVRRVIVDLRDNSGGDSMVVKPLVKGLKSHARFKKKGGVYVLIGRHTFSSGIFAARDLRDEVHAILVGEPTGAKPNGYGNAPSFRLPNSKLEVSYCISYFTLVKGGNPAAIDPDIPASLSLADLLAGRDPALEIALHHVP